MLLLDEVESLSIDHLGVDSTWRTSTANLGRYQESLPPSRDLGGVSALAGGGTRHGQSSREPPTLIVLKENSPVVRIEDNGTYWVWIRHRTRAARGITGKILFFSPDREALIAIARNEIEEHGFAHAKVSRSLEGSQTDYVLCLYDTGPERVAEARRRHPEAHCPGWKSDAATERGEYSQKYLRSVTKPTRPISTGPPPAQPATPPQDWSASPKTLEDALDATLGNEALRKKLRAVGSDVIITANVRSDRDWQRNRHIRSGRISAASWRLILKAWELERREDAADLFVERYGIDSEWYMTPEFKEIKWLEIIPKPRTKPHGSYLPRKGL